MGSSGWVSAKKNVTPLLMHWSYIFLALTHWSVVHASVSIVSFWFELKKVFVIISMKQHLIEGMLSGTSPSEFIMNFFLYKSLLNIIEAS